MVVDATGLKIFGQGEWTVAKHGAKGLHAGWRKLHLCIDEEGLITSAQLTDSGASDASQLGDHARGNAGFHRQCHGRWRLRHDSLLRGDRKEGSQGDHPSLPRSRAESKKTPSLENRHVERIDEVGRQKWRVEAGYHRQARAENGVYRYKKIIGPNLRARSVDGQLAEVKIACKILNKMFELGAPRSAPIAR